MSRALRGDRRIHSRRRHERARRVPEQVEVETLEYRTITGGIVRNGSARPHLDLWALNRQEVVAMGVPTQQIEVAELCTRCNAELFFSHRAQGYPAGRFSAAIGLR